MSPRSAERHTRSGRVEASAGGDGGEGFIKSVTGSASSRRCEEDGWRETCSGSRGRAQGASEASAYGSEKQSASGSQRSPQQFGERGRRGERRTGRSGRQVRRERKTGSLHQSGREPRGRFGL